VKEKVSSSQTGNYADSRDVNWFIGTKEYAHTNAFFGTLLSNIIPGLTPGNIEAHLFVGIIQ